MRIYYDYGPMPSDTTDPQPSDTGIVANMREAAHPTARNHDAPWIVELINNVWSVAGELHNQKFPNDVQRTVKNHDNASCTWNDLSVAIMSIDVAIQRSRKSSKFDEGLKRFSKFAPAIDVLIQQQPNITSIVWGSCRIILSVLAAPADLALEIEEGMLLIMTSIDTWYQIIESDYNNSTILDMCYILFSHVLTFLVEARIYCEANQKTNFARLWKANVTSTTNVIGGAIKDIRSYSQRLGQYAQAILRSKETQHHENTQRYVQLLIQESMEQITFGLDKTEEENYWRREVNEAIEILGPEHQGPWNIPERTQNTCHWVVDNQVYQNWEMQEQRRVLWIHGQPGCGKSVLATFLMDRLASSCQPNFTHFFSLNTNKSSADERSFAISMVIQILKTGTKLLRTGVKLIDATYYGFLNIVGRIATTCIDFGNTKKLSFDVLKPLIRDALSLLEGYTLIVDALDECSESGKGVVNMVQDLMRDTSRSPGLPPKIIIISRTSDKLTEICAGTAVLEIDAKLVMPDIELFVEQKVAQIPCLQPLHTDIIAKLREKCRGHFLWARTMIEYLQAAKNSYSRLKRLETLPDTLKEIYEEAINMNSKGKKGWQLKLRREILLLVLNPRRALTVNELEIALQFKTRVRQDIQHRLDHINDKELIELCQPLVTIVDKHVILTHTLVEDFLTATSLPVHITRAESNATLAYRCLNVLSEEKNRDPQRISYWLYKNVYEEYSGSTEVERSLENKTQDILVLYQYAAENWDYHLVSVGSSSPAIPELIAATTAFLHNFEFVMYGEFLYDLRFGEIGPILQVLSSLKSWSAFLSEEQKVSLNLDKFYQDPYEKLAQKYTEVEWSPVLQYLCRYRLGDFYTLLGKSEDRFQAYKNVSEGLQEILGKDHPLVLKARFMFIACLPPRREYEEALKQAVEVSELQEAICGLERSDYWKTLQLIADVQFYMTDFEAAAETEAKVLNGWTGVTKPKKFNIQIGYMMSGHIYEARGLLKDSLIEYELVERNQKKLMGDKGDKDVVTLYAQVSMGSVYRKQNMFPKARSYFDPALAERQMLYGELNKSVVDTMIQIIILDREVGVGVDAAQARIDILLNNESLDDKYERYCQVQHLQGLLYYDQGQTENAATVLRILLHEQTEKGRDSNNRPLLWVRLTLATILRELGQKDEASSIFMDIVTTSTPGDESPTMVRIETPEELDVAEKALRYIRAGEQQEANDLLQEHKMEWTRKADFWMLEGIPAVDTAFMKGP